MLLFEAYPTPTFGQLGSFVESESHVRYLGKNAIISMSGYCKLPYHMIHRIQSKCRVTALADHSLHPALSHPHLQRGAEVQRERVRVAPLHGTTHCSLLRLVKQLVACTLNGRNIERPRGDEYSTLPWPR